MIEPEPASGFVEALGRAGDVAEAAVGGGAGFVGCHAGLDQTVGLDGDVGADLLREIVNGPPRWLSG
jgi:hypothetical protein